MTMTSERLQTLINAAILIVALSIVAVLVNRHVYTFFRKGSAKIPVTNTVTEGSQLHVSGVDWSKDKLTVVLVLAATCRYSIASAPFYQRLIQEVRPLDHVSVMAMMPKSTENPHEFLKGLGLEVDEIKQPAQKEIGVKGTPTLLLVNKDGLVLNIWVGKLSEAQESEVIEQVRANLLNID